MSSYVLKITPSKKSKSRGGASSRNLGFQAGPSSALAEYNLFRQMNASKRWTSARMGSEYQKQYSTYPPTLLECNYRTNRRGETIEKCRPLGPGPGYYGGYEGLGAYGCVDDRSNLERLQMAGAFGLSKRQREAALYGLGQDNDNINMIPPYNVGGTFQEDMFDPKPETELGKYSMRDPAQFCSKNKIFTLETNTGTCIKPDRRKVFNILHKKNWWMKVPQFREPKFIIWSNRLSERYLFDEDAIQDRLTEIIKKHSLNPSERLGGGPADAVRRCPDDACYALGEDCVAPTSQQYFDNLYTMQSQLNMPEYAKNQARAKADADYAKFMNQEGGICKEFRARKWDRLPAGI